MSLLDDLAVRAHEADPGWVDRAVAAGRREFASSRPAQAALDALEARKADVGGLSRAGFAAVLARLALDQPDEAALVYLRQHASFAERMQALDAAHKAAADRHATDAESWRRCKALALDVLAAAGKAALPLLLAAV